MAVMTYAEALMTDEQRPSHRPQRTGWESLSRTELRVTALVVEGWTYREIGELLGISRRTVETHVAHVFTKLGISSRGELTQIAEAEARGEQQC